MFRCAANPRNKMKSVARYVMTFDQLREQGFTELRDDCSVTIAVSHVLKGKKNKDVRKVKYLAINQVVQRLILLADLNTVINISIGGVTKTYKTALLGLVPTDPVEITNKEYATQMYFNACLRDPSLDGMLLEVCEDEDKIELSTSLRSCEEYEFALEAPAILEVEYHIQSPARIDPLLYYWLFKSRVMEGKVQEKRFGYKDKFYFKPIEVVDVGKVKIETNYSSESYEITSIDISMQEVTMGNGAYVMFDYDSPIQIYQNSTWKPTEEEKAAIVERDKKRAAEEITRKAFIEAQQREVEEFVEEAPVLTTVEMKPVFTLDGKITSEGKREYVNKWLQDNVIYGYWEYDEVSRRVGNGTLNTVKPDFIIEESQENGNYTLKVLNNTDLNLDDYYLCFCYMHENWTINKVSGATVSLRKPFDDMFKKLDEQDAILKQLKEGTYQW